MNCPGPARHPFPDRPSRVSSPTKSGSARSLRVQCHGEIGTVSPLDCTEIEPGFELSAERLPGAKRPRANIARNSRRVIRGYNASTRLAGKGYRASKRDRVNRWSPAGSVLCRLTPPGCSVSSSVWLCLCRSQIRHGHECSHKKKK